MRQIPLKGISAAAVPSSSMLPGQHSLKIVDIGTPIVSSPSLRRHIWDTLGYQGGFDRFLCNGRSLSCTLLYKPRSSSFHEVQVELI